MGRFSDGCCSSTKNIVDVLESSRLVCWGTRNWCELAPVPCRSTVGHALGHVDIGTATAGLAYREYAVDAIVDCAREDSSCVMEISLRTACLGVFIRRAAAASGLSGRFVDGDRPFL